MPSMVGLRFHPPQKRRKTLKFLHVHHAFPVRHALLNVRVCSPDFAMRALQYRNDFDACRAPLSPCRTPLCRTPLSSCREPHSVSVSNLPVLLYLSVACCGSSVHHKTGYSLYIYLQHSTTYIHLVPRTRLFSPIARTHPPHFFPLHPQAWSSGQSTRGVAEVGRKPRLTSWMASSQTDAISIHFPLVMQAAKQKSTVYCSR